MGLRVRKKKNQSGSISVQIVDRTNRGYKVVETLGCSDDETEIDKLHQKAILRINDLSQNLFSKSLDETSEKLLLKKLLSKLTTQDFIPIAMTANVMEGDKEKCISAGMNDYISKPLDFNKFYQTLSKWLKVKNKFNKSVEEKNDSSDLNINNLEIEGIDITEALSRMAGDVKLFIKQLDRFVQSQEDFKNRVLNKNLDVSIREAHILKGVAGNIGANNLSNIAKELEYNLKVKGFDSNSEYLVEKLDEELQELILKIKEKLKTINLVKNDENICSQDINKEKISKLIEEL